MDIKNNKINYIVAVMFAVLALMAGVGIFGISEVTVYADEIVSDATLKSTVITGVNGCTPIYVNDVVFSDSGYKKNVKAEFTVNADFYAFSYKIDDGDEIKENITVTPADKQVVFSASSTGIYTLTCIAYSDNEGANESGRKQIVFKSDNEAPVIPDIESMTEWKTTGNTYYVNVDWNEYSDISGIYGIYYFFTYSDGVSQTYAVNMSTAGKEALPINRSCTLTVVCYDKAGNGTERSFTFDNFDDVAPPQPAYRITPTLTADSYAKNYTIVVDYAQDALSGLSTVQHYLLNGRIYEYDGSIVLDVQTNYNILLYSTDKAGNRSDYVEINVKNTNFDMTSPIISGLNYTIDVTSSNGICSLSFIGSDSGESGIASAYLETAQKYFTKRTLEGRDVYTVEWDCYYQSALAIKVTDYAGNMTTQYTAVSYFDNEEISGIVKRCAEKYKTLIEADYTATRWTEITEAYSKLNSMLMVTDTTVADIISETERINLLADTGIEKEYKIVSKPDYASATISFSVNAEAFDGYKKGDKIGVELKKGAADTKDYVALTSFGKGFVDYFDLTVTYNGVAFDTDKPNGIIISMNMPLGYYEREIMLYNTKTGEAVETSVTNNKINFSVANSGSYALVISGGKAVSSIDTNEQKTVTVFDKTFLLSSFLGIVCGIAAGALVLVGVVIIIMKRRR